MHLHHITDKVTSVFDHDKRQLLKTHFPLEAFNKTISILEHRVHTYSQDVSLKNANKFNCLRNVRHYSTGT